jgi:YbbR domain-containing protein
MQKNKVFSALISLVIAFCLWPYVITVDNPDYKDTIYDIPLTFVNETALKNRNLVITDISADSVDITFSGNRTDVLKLNKSNTR